MALPAELRTRMIEAAVMPSLEFVNTRLLDGPPYVFVLEKDSAHDAFTREMSNRLEVPPDGIQLIGSARLGFSLNKEHLLHLFGRSSDLDLVVVSADLFDRGWEELNSEAGRVSLSDADERRRLKKARETVAHGFFRPDQLPISTSLATGWFPRLAGPFEIAVARRHPVRAWLFRTWTLAQTYYSTYVESVQPALYTLLRNRGEELP